MYFMEWKSRVSALMIRRTGGTVSQWNFAPHVLHDLYDRGYNVATAADTLLKRIGWKE